MEAGPPDGRWLKEGTGPLVEVLDVPADGTGTELDEEWPTQRGPAVLSGSYALLTADLMSLTPRDGTAAIRTGIGPGPGHGISSHATLPPIGPIEPSDPTIAGDTVPRGVLLPGLLAPRDSTLVSGNDPDTRLIAIPGEAGPTMQLLQRTAFVPLPPAPAHLSMRLASVLRTLRSRGALGYLVPAAGVLLALALLMRTCR